MKTTPYRILSAAFGMLVLAGFNTPASSQVLDPHPETSGIDPREADEFGNDFYLPDDYQFVPGDVIPDMFHIYLKPMPDRSAGAMPDGEVIVRQWGDVAYYLEARTFKVLKVVRLHGLASR